MFSLCFLLKIFKRDVLFAKSWHNTVYTFLGFTFKTYVWGRAKPNTGCDVTVGWLGKYVW